MRLLLTILTFILAFGMLGQSKKELQQALSNSQRTIDLKNKEITSLNKEISSLEDKIHILKMNAEKTSSSILNILPFISVTEGFPEQFYPAKDNLDLWEDIYTLRQTRRRSDTTIESYEKTIEFPGLYDGEPDTVILLGVIDTTLYENYANVIYGTVPVLYKNKIWYTTFFELHGSVAVQKVKRNYKKKLLVDEFGPDIAEKIAFGEPWIGMGDNELKAMFGYPDDRSSYQNANGTVYIHRYEVGYRKYRITLMDWKVVEISRY